MAQFYPIVLEHLEHYRPELFAELKAERRLRAYVEDMVARLYAETERVLASLREQYPKWSDEQLRLEAEGIVIAEILPVSDGETNHVGG